MAAAKKSTALAIVLAVSALFLVVSGIALFWIAFRGVQFLKDEANHADAAVASASIDGAVAGEDEDDEDAAAIDPAGGTPSIDAGPCPLAIHPSYCRRRCRTFGERKVAMHARRVSSPTRAGVGTCGAFNVFAEDDERGGIVEYYDATTNQLVGAIDRRAIGCNQFGTIPTCAPSIAWQAPPAMHGRGLGSIR